MRLRHLTLTSALACAALAVPAAASAAPAVTATGKATAERGSDYALTLGNSGFTKLSCGFGYQVDWESDGEFDSFTGTLFPTVHHEFATLGPQTITVRGATTTGWWAACDPPEVATTTRAVSVVNAPPEVEISCLDAEAEVGADVFCETDLARDPDGEITALEWDVDGDGFDDGTGDELGTAFAAAGDKTIRLRATDDAGATAVAETLVEVYALAHGPAFEVSSDRVERGDPVTFTAPLAHDEGGDKEYERRWDVDGDGDWDEHRTGNPRLTWWYDEPGTYTVRLRVEQVDGDPRDATLATRTVTVTEPEDGGGDGGDGGGGGGQPQPPNPPAPTPPRAPTFAGTTGAAAKAPAKSVAKSTQAAPKKKCKATKAKRGKKAKRCKATPKKKKARK